LRISFLIALGDTGNFFLDIRRDMHFLAAPAQVGKVAPA
jgi:hypothetical protein